MGFAVAADGTIYYAAKPYMFAIDPFGVEKWRFNTGGLHMGTNPTIGSDGTIYIGTGNSLHTISGGMQKVYAVNPDGTEKWQQDIGEDIASSAVIDDDGLIYIVSKPSIHVFYPNGTEKMTRVLAGSGEHAVSNPLITRDNLLVVASNANHGLVETYDIFDLDLVWTYDTECTRGNATATYRAENFTSYKDRFFYETMAASPAINAEGVIFIGDGCARFHAINPDGTRKWVNADATERYLFSGAAINNENGTVVAMVMLTALPRPFRRKRRRFIIVHSSLLPPDQAR